MLLELKVTNLKETNLKVENLMTNLDTLVDVKRRNLKNQLLSNVLLDSTVVVLTTNVGKKEMVLSNVMNVLHLKLTHKTLLVNVLSVVATCNGDFQMLNS